MLSQFQRVSLCLTIAIAPLYSSTEAQAGATCSSYHSTHLAKIVNYCVQRSRPDIPARSGEPVVYYMHGMSGKHTSWIDQGLATTLDSLASGVAPFTVIAIQTSSVSFFSDMAGNSSGRSSYETWFIREFLNYAEKTFDVCSERRCRMLLGHSMGGFGAIKTGLRHSDLFSTIAATSPALPPFSIHDSNARWKEYWARQPVGTIGGMFLLETVRDVFPTEQLYRENNPLQLVDNFSTNEEFPAFYIDMGGQDMFGFDEGYALLKSNLDRRGFPYTTVFDESAGHDLFKKTAPKFLGFVSAIAAQTPTL